MGEIRGILTIRLIWIELIKGMKSDKNGKYRFILLSGTGNTLLVAKKMVEILKKNKNRSLQHRTFRP